MLFVFGHSLQLPSFALLSVLHANELAIGECTFGQAVGCLADHMAFMPHGEESGTLMQDVVALFEKLE